MRESTIYKKAIKRWGNDLQLSILQEECAELIQAISKVRRYGPGYEDEMKFIDDLAEEIADVEIMIEQAKHMYDWENFKQKISVKKSLKLERLKKLLEEEQ